MEVKIPKPDCIESDLDFIDVQVVGLVCDETSFFEVEQALFQGRNLATPCLMSFDEVLEVKKRVQAKLEFEKRAG